MAIMNVLAELHQEHDLKVRVLTDMHHHQVKSKGFERSQAYNIFQTCQLNGWDKVEANKVVVCDHGQLAFSDL